MRKIVLSLVVMLIAAFSAKALVYTVVVPEGTKACYIAGSMNSWSQEKMEQSPEDPTIFTIDHPTATKADKYKYCCGPGWAWVEKNAVGGEISDRSYPDDGMFIDYVETWALAYDPELDKEFTFNVTVPEGTKAVFVNGSFNNWSGFERMEKVTETTYKLTVRVMGAKAVNYKYASGPAWDYEEVQEDGSGLSSDRKLSDPASNDVVARWKEIYEPPIGVTLNVTVPEGTKACYVAGNMNDWKQQQMKRVTATTYTLTFTGDLPAELEYKYCSGPAWDYEELQADGSGLAGNRKLALADAPSNDVVAKWKAVYVPAGVTLNVTVPEGTLACYVAGNMNGWNQEKMEKVTDLTYTITYDAGELDEFVYKYCSGPAWDYEEFTEDDKPISDRKLKISDSPSDDVVIKWKAIFEPVAPVEITLNVKVPVGTKACYVAGSMNDWKQQKMIQVTDSTYTITLTVETDKIYYKYCSGPAWDYEEFTVDDKPISDRTLKISDSPSNDVVIKWKAIYEPSGIFGVNADKLSIIGRQANILVQFSGTASIELYNLQGALLDKAVATGAYNYAGLPTGIYIVKINGKAHKALVK